MTLYKSVNVWDDDAPKSLEDNVWYKVRNVSVGYSDGALESVDRKIDALLDVVTSLVSVLPKDMQNALADKLDLEPTQ